MLEGVKLTRYLSAEQVWLNWKVAYPDQPHTGCGQNLGESRGG